jgi:hypothetical protein
MADDRTKKVHNFLKWHFACTPGKQWARDKVPNAPGTNQFEYAWANCVEPFWMIRALHWLSLEQIVHINVDPDRVRNLASDAVAALAQSPSKFNEMSQAAYAIFLQYLPAPHNADLDAALAKAHQGVVDSVNNAQGFGRVSVDARAARALVEAINCYHPRNNGNVAAIIDAADKATAFAAEARLRVNGGIDRNACEAERATMATAMRAPPAPQPPWLDLTDTQLLTSLRNYEHNVDLPPWDHDTERGAGFGPGISTPNGTTAWYASVKGSTTWFAYGTDGAVAQSRSATVHDNTANSDTAGAPTAPTTGNDWGFSFPNLTSGDAVTLTVTITDTSGTPASKSVSLTVG